MTPTQNNHPQISSGHVTLRALKPACAAQPIADGIEHFDDGQAQERCGLPSRDPGHLEHKLALAGWPKQQARAIRVLSPASGVRGAVKTPDKFRQWEGDS